ncbi:UPF0481 protein At3g47200-like isoform X1 [Jatropha curcas]|uniref:UPF0481 protein At3g47200-like isoform X1 n=1 Tax=Jatropha curcas TaxID=180498 RepID=UPI001893112C|nr:UPF0481 protein At3g47200-like isoform X1 [Jatropha curcas]XP_037494240.1 UPF0481 protein At3g47200-like isoform X2 [Jatropha curcas]XP_037494241.1 UPF0481 protein At3g47200-like isoform X1 [Jatropha curcas]
MGQNGAGSNNSNDVKDESRRQLVIDIPDNLEDLLSQPALWPEICIYRVPRKLRAISPSAYTPQMISIGPFHHNEKSLKPMEKHKLRYLAEFCRRTGKNWADLAEKIIEWEEKIRHCYDQTFESYESNMFVKMILLDSVFIIEFFLRRGENFISTEKYKADYMLGKPSREHGILEDLILLENQLPYFVLEDLYEFATGNSGFLSLVSSNLLDYLLPPRIDDDDHKKNRSCDCFSIFYGFWISNRFCCQKEHKDDESTSVEGKEIEEKPKHLTDLVRRSRSYKHPVSKNDACIESLYSATKLNEAGVKFKVDKKAWPLDIKFERGELKMPRFEVHDGTERLIRNLMAFEQCHYPNDPYICDYILILDFLVDTEKDVELLIQNGIITNLLGECKSVAKMVNKLCLEITTSGSCFYGVSVDLNKHYENPWFKTVAIMRSVYFSDLWRGTGTIAAVILLFLTFIQSVYSLSRIF